MRLPKQKMAKQIQKQHRTAKHKDSDNARIKKEKKAEKANAMEGVTEESSGPELTTEQKAVAKMERKKLNSHNLLYKKRILSHSHKNGPRAINKVGFSADNTHKPHT